MTEYYKIKNEFRENVKTLRKNCHHDKLSRWEKQWNGIYVKRCLKCNERLKFSFDGKKEWD